jgi:hypothetical protein
LHNPIISGANGLKRHHKGRKITKLHKESRGRLGFGLGG